MKRSRGNIVQWIFRYYTYMTLNLVGRLVLINGHITLWQKCATCLSYVNYLFLFLFFSFCFNSYFSFHASTCSILRDSKQSTGLDRLNWHQQFLSSATINRQDCLCGREMKYEYRAFAWRMRLESTMKQPDMSEKIRSCGAECDRNYAPHVVFLHVEESASRESTNRHLHVCKLTACFLECVAC